jgi:hypothetical protein
MAEASRFWTTNNTGDGPTAGYSSANFTQFVRESFTTNPATEGVLYGIGNNLAVTGSSSPVAVNTGAALVYGFYYTSDASTNVTIATPATLTRVDVIVLRVSWAAQTVRITRVAGTEGAGTPAITQVANTTWDIPLANVSITTGGVITVTDRRTYVKHPGVYGWLNAALTLNSTLTTADDITLSKSASGGYSTLSVINTSNTAGSFARELLQVAGSTADDPYLQFNINGVQQWAAGVDNSDSDKFKISAGAALGTNDALVIDTSGNVSAPSGGLNASQLSSGTVPLARLSGISTSQLAADSVDDTIAGNRVPQFYRRQGSSSSSYWGAGVNNYTPTAVRMQAGHSSVSSGTPVTSQNLTITFPVAFSQSPLILHSVVGVIGSSPSHVVVSSISGSSVTLTIAYPASGIQSTDITWLAIGPE